MKKQTIIAIGNGGFNIAQDLISAEIFPEHTLIVVDTSKEDLERNSVNADKYFLVEALNYNKKVKADLTELVDNIIDETVETVVICTALGGKTGSKYAPLIALDAILRGKFVVSLTSMPFSYEGKKKWEKAANSKMQLIASSNISIVQDNDRLSEIDPELNFGELNNPIIDTLKSIMSFCSLKDASETIDRKQLDDLIPLNYRLSGVPLIQIYDDCYVGISNEKRKELFNDLS
ncbi:MAG: hypothetical protein J1E99_03030 [Muribaculaceae bacterium]|nr:hypothetical protein [Muribaculaceae bacterium]